MKKFIVIIFFITGVILCYQNRFRIYSFLINIEGQIDMSREIKDKLKPNSMLYIIVKNDKNITFAVKEIINPDFPLRFKINRKNVLYPYISSFNVKIETTINLHGEIGNIRPGDYYSKPIDAIIFSRRINIKIDRIK